MPSSRLPMSWSRWIDGARLAAAAALLIALAAPANAEENPACGQFKWPLTTEKSWFEAGNLHDLESAATLDALTEGAFTVTLKPSADVGFALKPEGKPSPDKPLGAIVSFAAVTTPDSYQITLSDEAWIDVV